MTDETETPPQPKKHKTGGRKKGVLNRKTVEKLAAQAEVEAELRGDGTVWNGTAHELVQAVYRNPKLPLSVRTRAAVDAMRHERAPEPSRPEFICRMPLECPDLETWRRVLDHNVALLEAQEGLKPDSVTLTMMQIEEEAERRRQQ